jgi:hypothetical protein
MPNREQAAAFFRADIARLQNQYGERITAEAVAIALRPEPEPRQMAARGVRRKFAPRLSYGLTTSARRTVSPITLTPPSSASVAAKGRRNPAVDRGQTRRVPLGEAVK